MNLKREKWKPIENEVGESSSKIIDDGINSIITVMKQMK